MKKHAIRLATLLCLCFAFSLAFGKADVSAAGKDVTEDKVDCAFIYEANDGNAFYLRYEDFGSEGYTFSFTDADDNVVFAGNKAVGKRFVKIAFTNVEGGVNPGDVFTLKLEDTDSGDYVSVDYFVGAGMDSQTTTNKQDTITSNWTVSKDDPNTYDSFTSYILSDKYKLIQKKSADSTSTSLTMSSSDLDEDAYRTYVIANKDDKYGYAAYYPLYLVKAPKQVPALTVTPDTGSATLSWSSAKNATTYEVFCKEGSGSFNSLGKKPHSKSPSTTYTKTGLTAGKKYSFMILAHRKRGFVSLSNSSKIVNKYAEAADYSPTKSVTIPKVAGKVQGAQFSLDNYGYLFLSWKKTAKATAYEVYRKAEGDSSYKMILKTKKTKMKVKGLNDDTKYTFLIYAVSGKYRSSEHATKKIKPADYYKAHRRFLASRVKTIRYVGLTRCITTKKKYSKAVREAYVNQKGYSSRSKYLILACLYTQQGTIFKGSKGKWKAWKSFLISSGAADGRTPRGTFTIKYKEKRWQHNGWYTGYIAHFYKKASFHARPMYNSGKIKEKTLGRPISSACIRCPTPIAKFIYSSIPVGTKVRVR